MFAVKKICGILLACLFLVPICHCESNSSKLQGANTENSNCVDTLNCITKDGVTTVNLEGTKNTRDLGGYKTSDGKTTKNNIFFRSDNTNKLTDTDVNKLKEEFNLKHVIDLRYSSEIAASTDKLSNVQGVTYYNIPLYIPKEQMIDLIKGNIDLGDAYIKSLEQKETVKNIFDTIAGVDNGALLFHCTNGKDRTGTVAALLLGLCGVSDKDILKDYSITYELIKNSESVKKGIENYGTDTIFKSLPEYMNKFLDHINQNYKSVENYLIECGVSTENISKIKEKFTA